MAQDTTRFESSKASNAGVPRQGIYARYIKRALDFLLSFLALALFWWLLAIIAILVRVKLGSPVIFKQPRPGKDEKVFTLYKFRSMTDERDENGDFLPDEIRLTKFGRTLRSTSLDELPELFNIFKGDLALVGPRPQLVRDMVFMTKEQRRRHSVRPGLTGLAQISGRNSISWDQKLLLDQEYLENISFREDFRIVIGTAAKVLEREGIGYNESDVALDFGDALLAEGRISEEIYEQLQQEASCIVREAATKRGTYIG